MGRLLTAARLHAVPLLALATVVIVTLAAPGSLGWLTRSAIGWDTGVGLFLIGTTLRLTRARSTDDIRKRASELDEAGRAVLPVSLLAAVASTAVVLGEVGSSKGQGGAALLALGTVALSWSFVHLVFALHYAHEFYAPEGRGKTRHDRGGLIFPGESAPNYWDFLHFALIIGVANQTADIQIANGKLRRISTLHSVTAFFFNTVILALSINLAASLF